MIQTKFNAIIDADKMHNQFALNKKGDIGIFKLWAWNNSYRFLNYDKNKIVNYQINKFNANNFTFLTKEEALKIINTKNRPKELFFVENNRIQFIGDKDKYTERQQLYGLINDNILDLMYSDTNKLWTQDFCRDIASIVAYYNCYAEIIKKHGGIKNISEKERNEYITKYMISADESDMYTIVLKKLGMEDINDAIMTEFEIHKAIKKVYDLPGEYQKSILSNIQAKKEINYYKTLF